MVWAVAQRAIQAAVSSTPRVQPASRRRPSGATATTPLSFGGTPGRPWPHARSIPRTRTRRADWFARSGTRSAHSVEGVRRDEVGVAVEDAQGVVLAGRRHTEHAAAEPEGGVV